ncbi:MAG: DUF4190 domain-containing protein [Verrucomicrobia bacterium]|nr:DUF4190 domain-containing protein [Verrucomicrobiota bacterium]
MSTPPNIPPPLPTQKTAPLAVASLVLGVCIVVAGCLAGLPALIFGIIALSAINRSGGQLAGRGMAIAGICLGGASIILIPILLALLFPAITAVKSAANKAKTGAVISQLSIAIQAYNNEYDRWPQPRNAGDLVLIFSGLRDPRTGKDVSEKRPDLLAQNPRRIFLMDFRAKDVTPAHPSGKPGADELSFCDPWGTPYGFAFDNGQGGAYFVGPGATGETVWADPTANDGVIPGPFSAEGADVKKIIRAGFAIFSNGPDGRTGTPETEKDDIRSWK